jgi:hypothetical protein
MRSMLEALIAFLMICCFVMGYFAGPPEIRGSGGGGGEKPFEGDPEPWPELDRLIDEWSRGSRPAA